MRFAALTLHRSIKSIFRTSEYAVKTHVWIAVSICVVVSIVRKRPALNVSLYETLPVLSLTISETMPLHQLRRFDPLVEISSNSCRRSGSCEI